jgi:DNA-binding winged helix-turn-helix (wHTH) protein
MVFAFADFELDVAAGELRRAGEAIPLQPKVFDTLRYLIEHRDHVVTKQELLDAFWEGESMNPVAVPWSISHARKALGQRRSEAGPIETLRGKGYRFVVEVRRTPQAQADRRLEAAASALGEGARRRAELFLGRDDVMDRLGAALNDARAGQGRVCLLTGDAGIGKTRCAEELTSFARRSGLGVWQGRCVDAGGAPAFWLWIQVLRASCADRRTGSAERKAVEAMLARLTPGAAPAPEALRPTTPALTDTSRFWLSEALVRTLRQTAENRLRVVVLEDLHAADEGSLEVLGLLAPELRQTRMLVVATSRGASAKDGIPERPPPTYLSHSEIISLSGLSFEDTERYVSQALGQPAAPELARAIHERTSGVPLFLKEAARLLATRLGRRGTLRGADVELPEVARQLLIDRLATLDAHTRRALDAAAIVGEEFDLSVLQRVVEMPPDQLLSRLDVAVRSHFVQPRPGSGVYAFAHALIREALSAELPPAERRRLHGRAADALRSVVAVGPRLSAIAYHLHQALPEAEAQDVAHFSRLAGDSAMQVFAYDEAAEFYGWALTAHGYGGARDARGGCELCLSRTLALRRAGRVSEPRAQCQQAIEIALRENFPDLLVEAARALRPTVWAAQVPDEMALGALEQAIERLPDDAKAARARAYALLACIPPHSSSVPASRELSERAVRLARELGDRQVLLAALVSTFHGLSGPDAIDDLLAKADEVLRLDGPTVSYWSAEAFLARYNALLQRGDSLAADRALEAFGECAKRLRMPEAMWQYERLRAQEALYTGEFDRARARFGELFAQGTRFPTEAMFQYAAQMSALSWEREGRPLAAAALGSTPEIAWKWAAAIPAYRAEKILALMGLGDTQSARAEFADLAKHGFGDLARDLGYLYTLSRLTLAAVLLEERTWAEGLYELLRPYPHHNAINPLAISLGSVSHYLGLAARFLGRGSEAVAHFEQSVVHNQSLGHPVHALRSQLALAELTREQPSGTPDDLARSLAVSVQVAARDFGMTALAEDAARLMEARTESPPNR